MILYIIRFIIMYIILAFFCYFLYWKLNLDFYRNNGKIELSFEEKRVMLIWMSALWIFYLPRLLIDYLRR